MAMGQGNTDPTSPGSRLILLTLLAASSLTVMSGATVSPSLPGLQESFSQVESVEILVRLVLTMPALFIAIFAPLAGSLVDRVGRKQVLLFSVILYGIAGGSGLVLDSLYAILAGRALLGVAVAGVMTSATALIADYYSGQALNIEAGTNDIVVLPTLLILIALANAEASGIAGWAILVGEALILGPVIGFAIGADAAWLMSKADKRFGVSEVYQSLYSVGIVLLSYSVATALGGDGFLAAFATGFAVAVLNFDLCQCFLDYGETTSEMAMLLAFILFGVVISNLFSEVPLIPALILAAIVIFIARPLAIGIVLRKAAVSNKARAFIGWFGPRGLNSLLLALLVLQAGVANSEFLLAIVGVVVTVSVIAHGASATPLSQAYSRAVENDTHEEERDNAGGIFEGDASSSIRIKPERLAGMLESEEPPVVLDVRTRSQYEQDKTRIPGSERVAPDQVEEWVKEREEAYGSQVEGQRIVAYCT
jgi:MFS family permease